MHWLLGKLLDAFEWLWDALLLGFRWICDELVWVANKVCNHISAFASGLLATLAGVMPAESLSETWQNVIFDWLDGTTAGWFAVNALALPELLARGTYLAGVVAAAYVARAAFAAVRAALDLL